MEILLNNPSFETLKQETTNLLNQANKGQRTRRLFCDGTIENYLWDIANSKMVDGYFYANGGSVPNNYRQAAYTTAIGVAWWKDPDPNFGDTTWVKIIVERRHAPKAPFAAERTINLFACDYGKPESIRNGISSRERIFPAIKQQAV